MRDAILSGGSDPKPQNHKPLMVLETIKLSFGLFVLSAGAAAKISCSSHSAFARKLSLDATFTVSFASFASGSLANGWMQTP